MAYTEDDWLEAHFRACAPEYRAMLAAVGIAPGARVVDIGCGTGLFIPWIAGLAGLEGSVVAVDSQAEKVEAALAQVASAGLRVECLLGSALDLPLETGSVDVAWCANVFEYLSLADQVAALKEMVRVVRPGGRIAVKDSEFAHKLFYPTDAGLWYRFLAASADVYRRQQTAGPFVGRSLGGGFIAAGLRPTLLRTYLSERRPPLSHEDEAWIRRSGQTIVADMRARLGPADRGAIHAFAACFEAGSPADILARPDFYYCEASVLAVAVRE